MYREREREMFLGCPLLRILCIYAENQLGAQQYRINTV